MRRFQISRSKEKNPGPNQPRGKIENWLTIRRKLVIYFCARWGIAKPIKSAETKLKWRPRCCDDEKGSFPNSTRLLYAIHLRSNLAGRKRRKYKSLTGQQVIRSDLADEEAEDPCLLLPRLFIDASSSLRTFPPADRLFKSASQYIGLFRHISSPTSHIFLSIGAGFRAAGRDLSAPPARGNRGNNRSDVSIQVSRRVQQKKFV